MTTQYDRAPMPPNLNAIVRLGPDGEVVITLKDDLIEQHNEEAVAIMLGEARRAGWPVSRPNLAAVDEVAPSTPRHAARHSRKRHGLNLLRMSVVVFFFAAAASSYVSYNAGLRSDEAADAAASTQTMPHMPRRRPARLVPAPQCTPICQTPSLAQTTPDGSGVQAQSVPAPPRPTSRACGTGTRRWDRRTWCRRYAWQRRPGGSSPPAPWPPPSSQPSAGAQETPQPPTPYAPLSLAGPALAGSRLSAAGSPALRDPSSLR